MDYYGEYYEFPVKLMGGGTAKVTSVELRHGCHDIYSVEGIEYIAYIGKDTQRRNLDKCYAVDPEKQEKLETAFNASAEKYRITQNKHFEWSLDSGKEIFDSVLREEAYTVPEAYGLHIVRITKNDIQKLLRGDILYYEDGEYVTAIGLPNNEIRKVDGQITTYC